MKKIALFFYSIFILLLISNVNIMAYNISSYCVLDTKTNNVLESSNANKKGLVASTVKILTALTVIENYNMFDIIKINSLDVNAIGSKVYLKEGEMITNYELLHGLLLRSGNDCASALSKQNSKSFIKQMNILAKRIGMNDSTFENASGLDEVEYNLSTAYDMALLTSYASKNEVFREIASKKSFSFKSSMSTYYWENKHKLVRNKDEFVLGKTGYTKKSGRILSSLYETSDVSIVIFTMNDGNDWNHHLSLAKENSKYHEILILKKGIYEMFDGYIKLDLDIYYPYKENDKLSYTIYFIKNDKKVIIKIKINDDLFMIATYELHLMNKKTNYIKKH